MPQIESAGQITLPLHGFRFDVITCFMVVEHLEKPEACFEEFNRVCKSKGTVIIATPNLWHYSTLVVKLTPYWFHEWFVRVIISGSGGSFPTRYKANTPGRLGRGMELAGFQQIEMRLLDFGPPYLDWFTLGYALGLVWHRLINQFSKFAFLRETLLGIFQKP